MPHAAGPLPRDRDHHGRGLRVPVQRTRPPVHLVQSKAVAVAHWECSEAVAAVSLEYSVAGDWPACLAYSVAFVRPDRSILISTRSGTEQQESVFAISGAVVVGTILTIGLLSGFGDFLPNGWFAAWRDFT